MNLQDKKGKAFLTDASLPDTYTKHKGDIMATMTFHLHLANHPNKKGLFPVMLRITQNRKSRRITIPVEVRASEWNHSKERVRASNTDYQRLNEILDSEVQRAKDIYRHFRKIGMDTLEKVKDGMKSGRRSPSFLLYARNRTQEIYDTGGIRNWKKYVSFCRKLEKFIRARRMKDLLFIELTASLLAKFDNFLHTLPNERNPALLLHPNTIQVNLNIFKTLVNRAIEIDGLLRPEQNPFLKFKYKGVKTYKEKLDESELKAIRSLRLKAGSRTWHCRNFFFFSFYCAGIRAGDLIQLRWCNITSGDRLNYQMGKNHRNRDLPLVKKALDILKHYRRQDTVPTDYIFPLLTGKEPWAKYVTQEEKDVMLPDMKRKMFQTIGACNAIVNRELAKIRELAGIEKKVSFHISRHSFAKMAKEKGLDNLEVKALLAHTDLATTQKYIGEFDTLRNDAALHRVFCSTISVPPETTLVRQLQSMDPELLKRVLAKVYVYGNR